MTAFSTISTGKMSSSPNRKDGGRQPLVRITGFWGVEGFMPTAPNEWVYTWPGAVNCPSLDIVETEFAIMVNMDGETIRAFIDIPHGQVKDYLDNLILDMYRHDAEIAEAEIDWDEWQREGLAYDIDDFMSGKWVRS
jgi:hypothetical protein